MRVVALMLNLLAEDQFGWERELYTNGHSAVATFCLEINCLSTFARKGIRGGIFTLEECVML